MAASKYGDPRLSYDFSCPSRVGSICLIFKNKNADFTDVVEEHFGAKAGRAISLLYFLSIFPILLIYGVGITNTVDSFMVNQAGMASIPRPLLSGVLVFGLIAIMMAGEKVMLRALRLWFTR